VRLGDRVRVRIGNLTMTNHPIHLHGHHFAVSCTDGGWVPESAQWLEATTDVPVGAVRAIDFVADAPGDWAFHCHKSHHTMNAMGHNVVNLIGAREQVLAKAVRRAAPNAMAMGTDGMGMMAEMEMPLPDNTLPMMTGFGQFGPIEMGGMFTVMKVREGLAANDYKDPGPYKNPPGTVAYEAKVAEAGEPARQPGTTQEELRLGRRFLRAARRLPDLLDAAAVARAGARGLGRRSARRAARSTSPLPQRVRVSGGAVRAAHR